MLFGHAFELCKKILDGCLREVIDVDKMQYGFMPGGGTADAVFVLMKLDERFKAKDKKLIFVFIYSEKAFDRVPKTWFKYFFFV